MEGAIVNFNLFFPGLDIVAAAVTRFFQSRRKYNELLPFDHINIPHCTTETSFADLTMYQFLCTESCLDTQEQRQIIAAQSGLGDRES